jgi:hypothetical protein
MVCRRWAVTVSEATSDPEDGEERRTASGIKAALRHPLFVGLMIASVGALFASLLIPAMTRTWQDRPREIALKRSLIERVSSSSTATISQSRFFWTRLVGELGVLVLRPAARDAFFSRVGGRWQIESSAIGSELLAYFPDSEIWEDWREYTNAVQQYVEVTAMRTQPEDVLALMFLRAYLQHTRFSGGQEVSRKAFVRGGSLDDYQFVVGDMLLELRDRFNKRILRTDASGFSHGFWIFHAVVTLAPSHADQPSLRSGAFRRVPSARWSAWSRHTEA